MAISIDIGSRAVHIVSGKAMKTGSVVIERCKYLKIPPEVYSESPGSQQRSIFALLKPILDSMKVAKEKCHFTLSDDRFLIRELMLPKAPLDVLRNVAQQEMISLYNADEGSTVEIDMVRPHQEGMVSLRAAAFSKELANGYLQFVLDSKMIPASLCFHSKCISRLMSYMPLVDGAPIANRSIILADLGMFACIIHVIVNGNTVFSRYLPIGFNDLHQALTPRMSNNQGGEEMILSIAPLEATFDINSPLYLHYPPYIVEQVEAFLYRLTDEMSKMLRYISSSKVADNIDTVFLFGGGAKIPELGTRLSQSLNIYFKEISSVSNISIPANMAGYLPFLLNCAGSLLG